jgi:outer membrane protein
MEKFLALALAGACGVAAAQTPATNPMPDGSRDMYVGLGAVSAPRYEGGRERRVSALPVLQVQWSNGIFVSGQSAGMHLSDQPAVEYGPLVALLARRDDSGSSRGLGGLEGMGFANALAPPLSVKARYDATRLTGMDEIGNRLQAGGFVNVYLSPAMRLTNSLLYGSGHERNGLRWTADLQQLATPLAAHHALSLTAGLTLANRNDSQSYFGVSADEAARSINPAYHAGGGLRDVHLGARWNWSLTPAWMLTTNLKAARLLGSAKDSPLTERPTNVTVSTAIAYRF